MQAANVFSMYPKLEQHRNLIYYKKDNRMKPQQSDRNKEYDLYMLYPAEPEGYSEVIVFTTVMHNMCRPPKSLLVRNPVSPITAKIENDITG